MKDTVETKRNHNLTTPRALVELAETVGLSKAGAYLGLSSSAISTNIAERQCRIATELAAQYILAQLEAPAAEPEPENVLVVASVEPGKLKELSSFAGYLGVKLTEVAA